MKKIALLLILALLLVPFVYAQSDSWFDWNLFEGVFGKTEQAQEQTEKQLGEIIEHAEEFGGGARNFIIGENCVHYYVSPMNLVVAEYGSEVLRTDLDPQDLEVMLRQLEEDITDDLGNVKPTYREIILC